MGFFEDANTAAFGSSLPIVAPVSKIVEVIDDDNNAGGAFFGAATFNSTDLTSSRSTLALLGARGTQAVPSNVDLNDIVGEIIFNGHDGTSFSQAAYIQSTATETWSGITNGAQLVFGTTTNGGGSQGDRLTIDEIGDVSINGGDFIVEGDGTVARSFVLEERTDGDFVGFKAPDDILNTPVIWTLPDGDGANGQVLTTDGGAALDWADALTFPILELITEDGQALFDLTNDGLNEVARFDVANGSSSATTLTANNDGDGHSAYFSSTNATTNNPTVIVEQEGLNSNLLLTHAGIGGGQSSMILESFQNSSDINLFSANGTQTVPADLVQDDVIGAINFDGWNGGLPAPAASMATVATGNWAGGADQGTYFTFISTPSGSSTPTEMARIGDFSVQAFADGISNATFDALTYDGGAGPSQMNLLYSRGSDAAPAAVSKQ